MEKFFRLNVIVPFMLGLFMIMTSVVVIVWPMLDNQFSLPLIPVSLVFLIAGFFCFYGAHRFYKLNGDSAMRLTPDEKEEIQKQRVKKKKVSDNNVFVIVWGVLAILFGLTFFLVGIQDRETNFIWIGLGVMLLGVFVGVFLRDK